MNVTRSFYQQQRSDGAFDQLYECVVTQTSNLEISESKLPRYRKPPKRFGGSDPHQFDEPRSYFQQKYYTACDILIQELLDSFEQKEFMQPVLAMENLLIKLANGE